MWTLRSLIGLLILCPFRAQSRPSSVTESADGDRKWLESRNTLKYMDSVDERTASVIRPTSFTLRENGQLSSIELNINGTLQRISLEPALNQLTPQAITNRNDCHYKLESLASTNTIVQGASISNCDGNLQGILVIDGDVFVLEPVEDVNADEISNGETHTDETKDIHASASDQTTSFHSDENSQRAANAQTTDRRLLGKHMLYKRDVPLLRNNKPLTPPESTEKTFCGVDGGSLVIREYDDASQYDDAITSESSSNSLWPHKTKSVDMTTATVELALFADNELYNKFLTKHSADAATKLQDYLLTVINNIQLLYHQSNLKPSVDIKIVHYEVFTSQPDELAAYRHNKGEAQTYLDDFCNWQRTQTKRDWDHSLLFTGYDIISKAGNPAISGISRVNGMCDPWNACTLAEGLDFSAVFIATHELGHSFGMRHDEPNCASSHIMSEQLGPGKIDWSSCSQRDFEKFLLNLDLKGKNCLGTLQADETALDLGSTLPGQKYSADQQCELFHGPGYKQATPRRELNPDGLCYMIWCARSNSLGRIVNLHPALEGTYCGDGKVCRLGKCSALSTTSSSADSAPPSGDTTNSPTTEKKPQLVDGQWSAWSSPSCGSCACSGIDGGIGILLSTRTCTNPAPLNSGADCPGSSKRGVLCAESCDGRDSVQSYIDRVCKMRQRSDPELTGIGTHLKRQVGRACKVFCNTRIMVQGRPSYRSNQEDALPDGTPCGDSRYCVSGACMALSCSNQALISDPNTHSDCPSSGDVCDASQNSSAPPVWSQWTDYSACSTTCGQGVRTRGRSCSSGPGNCAGQSDERISCFPEECPLSNNTPESDDEGGYDGLWTGWSSWSECSVTCGSAQGVQLRRRNCYRGRCSGFPAEQTSCSPQEESCLEQNNGGSKQRQKQSHR